MPESVVQEGQDALPEHVRNPRPDIYLGDNYGVLDFETTNVDKGDPANPDNHLVLACINGPRIGRHSFWGSEFKMAGLLELIEQCDFLVCQGSKFEIGWLIRCGADIGSIIFYDTLLGAYSEDGNRRRKRDLDSLAEREGIHDRKVHWVSGLIKAGVCPSDIRDDWLGPYCWQDVDLTEAVFKAQRVRLHREGLLPFLYSKCLFTPVLADMERRGLCLDAERVTEEYETYTRKYNDIIRRLDEFTGGINPLSPKQMAEYVYDRLGFSEPTDHRGNPIRTETGKRSAGTENLKRLKPSSAEQREFIEIKIEQAKLHSAKSKSLDKYKACIDETDDGILYATYNQALTQTHRLSSTGKRFKAQFQNLDNRFKRLFRSRRSGEGWKVGEADSSQLEFRTAVWYGQDEQGMHDLANDVDAHSFTSHHIFGTPNIDLRTRKPEFDKQRYSAKAHTFKPLYGGRSGTPRERAYYEAFRLKFPQISETQEGWVMDVLKNKQLTVPTGLTFYWPDTETSSSGYTKNTTNIYNYPVQYLATAEVVPIAVVHQWHRMRHANMQSFLVNTVHDSSIGEVHPEEGELYQRIAVQSFREDVYSYLKKCYGIDWNVPLDCEILISTFWSEKDECV